jgi:hypothetical protein
VEKFGEEEREPLLTSVLAGCDWSTPQPGRLLRRGKEPGIHSVEGSTVPRAGFEAEAGK